MRMLLLCLLLACPFVLTRPADAQVEWGLSAETRYRGEFDDRAFSDEPSASTVNLLRTRIGLELRHGSGVRIVAQIQDSRVMGEETSTLDDGQADRLDMHQAYAHIPDLFGSGVDLKLGRFEAAYGSQRLIGAVGWSDTGRSFDGAIIRVASDRESVDAFAIQEAEELSGGDEGDLYVFGAYGVLKLARIGTVEPFLIWQRKQPTEELSRVTAGARVLLASAGFEGEIEGAYQAGTEEDESVFAHMVAVSLGYALPGQPALR